MQKLIQGKGSLLLIGSEALPAGTRKVFLIAGDHFFEHYSLDFLDGFEVETYRKKSTNVNLEECGPVFLAFRESKAEAIIAIGGGSVIDLGKTILFSYIRHLIDPPLFIAVPTTAGSGSEATRFAVVYRGVIKKSYIKDQMLPPIVILDPELTYSLSPYQTAVSGMDVIAQAIESGWSRGSDDGSKLFASAAIKLWKEFFLESVNNPTEEVRKQMQLAAYEAGKAINITRTTGPHALSYYLTAIHKVPHGLAVALFLPLFFIYNQPQPELCQLLQVNNEMEAKEFIQSAMKKAGLAISLKELGIDKKMIMKDLLESVNEERFANNPRSFDYSALEDLITKYL